MMLRAYLDESGIHGGSVCVVAGFVGDADFCDDLDIAWGHLLKKYKLAQFHAKQFAGGNGSFRAWDSYKREEFVASACHLIKENWKVSKPTYAKAVLVGAAIDREAFMSRSIDERRWLTGGVQSVPGKWRIQGAPTKPYFLLFQQCILDVAKFAEGLGRINFVFDWQTHYEHTGKQIFGAMRRNVPTVGFRAGSIVYTSRLQARPLQVADFIAYESHRMLIERKRGWYQEGGGPIWNLASQNTVRSVAIDGSVFRQNVKNVSYRTTQIFHASRSKPKSPI